MKLLVRMRKCRICQVSFTQETAENDIVCKIEQENDRSVRSLGQQSNAKPKDQNEHSYDAHLKCCLMLDSCNYEIEGNVIKALLTIKKDTDIKCALCSGKSENSSEKMLFRKCAVR